MNGHSLSQRFRVEETIITRKASDSLNPEDVCIALQRHARGDWGDITEKDAAANNSGLLTGCCRLRSAYRDRNGTEFWIITEADRSATTVMLAEY